MENVQVKGRLGNERKTYFSVCVTTSGVFLRNTLRNTLVTTDPTDP